MSKNAKPVAPVQNVVHRRSYYTPNSVSHGYGPTCETREEAQAFIDSADGIRGATIVVHRMTPAEYEAMDEFQGW